MSSSIAQSYKLNFI